MKCSTLIDMGYPEQFVPVSLQLGNNVTDVAARYLQQMKHRLFQIQNINVSETPRKLNFLLNSNKENIKENPQSIDITHNIDNNIKDNRNNTCPICNDDNPMKKDQLVPCTSCTNEYHTTCFGARRIPFSLKTVKEKQNREKFIKKHYHDWRCSICASNGSVSNIKEKTSLSSIEESPMSPKQQISPSSIDPTKAEFTQVLPNYSQTWKPGLTNNGDVSYSLLTEGNDDLMNKLDQQGQQPTNHDQAAFLIGILAVSGYNVESLMTLSVEKQREALIAATNHYNSKNLTPMKATTPIHGRHIDINSRSFNVINNHSNNTTTVSSIVNSSSSTNLQNELNDPTINRNNSNNIESKTNTTVDLSKTDLLNDPQLSKYYKMIKVGLPKMSVAQKMMSDGVVGTIQEGVEALNINPDQIKSNADTNTNQTNSNPVESDSTSHSPTTGNHNEVAVSEHPLYIKYFKMLKVGVHIEAVKKKMIEENLDPTYIDKNPNEMIPLEAKGQTVAVSEHPLYIKFFKMLKVGVHIEAVKKKMIEENLDPTYIDKNPNEMIPLEDTKKDEIKIIKVALAEHPVYATYFKMLKVGLQKGQIKNKMTQDGANPDYLDRDPTELENVNPSEPKKENGIANLNMKKTAKQAVVRKKRLHWKALDASKVGDNTLWANNQDHDDDIKLDEDEFNQLFVDKGENQVAKPDVSNKDNGKKKRINIIDMKRAQNGGISLARIKLSFPDVRTKIENMEDELFTTDQLLSLAEFLPLNEEIQMLKSYKGDVELLGQAEKYMIVMLNFPTAPDRIQCMIYKQQFKGRVAECKTILNKIEMACDDVKLSTKLKKVLKTILKVGNQMNDGEEHIGFTLDSLLKLQSAKAFDKKTSILQYVIMLIQRNDETILQFPSELPNISEASRIILDSVTAEAFQLRQGLDNACKVITTIRQQESGNLSAMAAFLYKATERCDELDTATEKVIKLLSFIL